MHKKRELSLRSGIVLGIILLILTGISLSGASVSAQGQSFSIAKDTTVPRTCPGSTLLLQSTVLSSAAQSFSLSQEGDAARFSISVPTGFILSAGGSKTLFSYVTPPSTTSPGTYRLKLFVNSASASASAEYNIVVEDCRAVSLNFEASSKSTCPGEVASYKAILRNIGRFTEDYSLSVDGQAKGFTTLSDSSVRLLPGQEKDVYAFVNPPFDVGGVHDFTLSARSASGITSSQARINVLPCYNYAFTSEKSSYEICEAEKLSIPLALENKGSVANSYKMSSSGSAFASLNRGLISLAPGQTAVAELIFSPSFGTQGEFPVKVNIEGALGKESKVLPINVKVKKCYDAQLDIAPETLALCNTFSSRQNVLIKNTGEFSNKFTLSVSGASFATLDREVADLSAGESVIATLALAPDEKTPAGNYGVVVKMTDPISKISSSDTLKVTTITREQCFLPGISLSQKVVEVPKDSAAAISFTVENRGREPAEYVLALSGNALQFSQINPSLVKVSPGESESVFLHVAPTLATAEGAYRITVTARLKESQVYASETVDIKVLASGAKPSIGTGSAVRETRGFADSLREFLRKIFRIEVKSTGNNTSVSQPESPQIPQVTQKPQEKPQAEKNNVTEEAQSTNQTFGSKGLMAFLRELFSSKPQAQTVQGNETLTQGSERGARGSERETQSAGRNGKEIVIDLPEEGRNKSKGTGESVANKNASAETERSITEGNKTSSSLTGSGSATKQFLSQYSYHLVAALILILLIILIATGTWRRIVEFFVEEEGKNGRKNGKKR
ncbi:MAG TPA: hypothetical protein HA250_02315 [Nanoarchaeota archaeon]|nr:hypothetical protein [Nanoarchaeota archaeon]